MHLRIFFLVIFALSCGAPAESADRSERRAAAQGVKVATQSVKEGKFLDAFAILRAQLAGPAKEASAARAVFQKKGAVDGLVGAFDAKTGALTSIDEALQLDADLEIAQKSGVIPSDAASQLETKLDASVAVKVAQNEFAATFGDHTRAFPSLAREPALPHVVDATLAALKRPYRGAFRSETVDILAAADREPALRQRLEAELPTLVFSISELQKYVAPTFPAFAASRMEDLTTRVALTSEPSRRLIEVDVGTALRSHESVQVVEDRAQAEAVVQIAELQYTERVIPQTTRTVTVALHEADILYAMLQMPENSTFQYEVVEGGTQLEWAYEISFTKDGATRRKLIRSTAGQIGYQCINPRIVNVFGGVIKSPGWPNKKTGEYCESSQTALAPTDVRAGMIHAIAQAVDDVVSGDTAP